MKRPEEMSREELENYVMYLEFEVDRLAECLDRQVGTTKQFMHALDAERKRRREDRSRDL